MVVKIEQAKKPTKQQTIDWEPLLAGVANGRSRIEYGANRNIFSQGESADSLFYLREGKVKLAVTSKQGKEAIVAILGEGDFFGEGCLAGQRLRMATASTITDCSMARIEKSKMARMLRQDHSASELFVTHLLSRNVRYEADLVDQLFNSSEKRLARTLLLLARYGQANPQRTLPKISQETLADMIGATRARVNFFMNKFRKLGLIEYNGSLKVNSSLLTVVLHD